jgi:ppGpp synthetase/RelA/SpoT-type nucleotidyltranferase
MRKEEILNRVKKETNIVHKINRKKANWSGQMLRGNCLLKHVTEGKTEDEEEDVSGYWMTLRNLEGTGN